MKFANPNALWLLIILPLLLFCIGYYGWVIKKEIIDFFQLNLLHRRREQINKYLLIGLLFILFVVGFAIPMLPIPSNANIQKTGEVLFLVDVSGSMGAQEDPDQTNRLDRIKTILLNIVDQMEQMRDVKVSLYGFTDIARSHVPFIGREDFPYLRESIKNVLNVYSIPGHGTSLGQPILNVVNKFSKKTTSRLILLFSDGEIFIGAEPGMHEVERAWLDEAITKSTENNIKVITIGIGELEGAKIPIENSRGNLIGDYAKFQGADYFSYLQEETLIELAARTGGKYFPENNEKELMEFIEKNLSSISSETISEESVDYQSVAHWIILIAVPLWIIVVRRYLLK